MTSKAVFIATPAYDEWVCLEYSSSVFETGVLLAQQGWGLTHAFLPGNPFLDLARNKLVDEFLASGCSDLLFIDADVGWDAKMVSRVLSYKEEVVGGLVPKRHAAKEDSYHDNALTGVISPEGLFQSHELPTAFMRIQRTAFEKLKKPYFKIGDNEKDFGEDIYFCRRWIETGNFCWIDSDITFTHRGGKRWKGNFYEHCLESGKLKIEKAEAA